MVASDEAQAHGSLSVADELGANHSTHEEVFDLLHFQLMSHGQNKENVDEQKWRLVPRRHAQGVYAWRDNTRAGGSGRAQFLKFPATKAELMVIDRMELTQSAGQSGRVALNGASPCSIAVPLPAQHRYKSEGMPS